MISYNRSNFPSDDAIAKRFCLTRKTVLYLRHDLIEEGLLTFKNGYFIPNE